jgi:hypothetical protein
MTDRHFKLFEKTFHSIVGHRTPWDVYADWLQLAASALYQPMHQDPDVEAEYKKVFSRYTEEDGHKMAQLLCIVIDALEEGPRDFLCEVFGGLELTNERNGQFFTPFHVSELMAKIAMDSIQRRPGHVLKIAEPACGAGGMVIAEWKEIKIEDREWTHFVATDIDLRCFYMAYIQLSLFGMSAEVIHGDTIRMTKNKTWRTLGFYRLGMADKLRGDRFLDLLAEGAAVPCEENAAPVVTAAILPSGRSQMAFNFEGDSET